MSLMDLAESKTIFITFEQTKKSPYADIDRVVRKQSSSIFK